MNITIQPQLISLENYPQSDCFRKTLIFILVLLKNKWFRIEHINNLKHFILWSLCKTTVHWLSFQYIETFFGLDTFEELESSCSSKILLEHIYILSWRLRYSLFYHNRLRKFNASHPHNDSNIGYIQTEMFAISLFRTQRTLKTDISPKNSSWNC